MYLIRLKRMKGLITNYNLQKTKDDNKKKNIFQYKNIIIIAASLCLFILIVLIPMAMKYVKAPFESNSTLPGATEINPAVMYNGTIYYWKNMSGPAYKMPQGTLPEGYEYVGDIKYTKEDNLTQDFQFISKFKATGQLYYNKNDTENIYICITTDWLDKAFVVFSRE